MSKVNEMDFYSFSATTLQGKEKSMEEFRGKVVLIVNTASKCGFTPQYEGLKFTKFLINREGIPVKRFSPQTKPEQMEGEIKKLFV
jgi:glutathione peroxidase